MNRNLRVDCRPSSALSGAVLLVHAIAAACAWVALPPVALLITLVGLLLSCIAHWQRARLRHPTCTRRLDWRDDGLSATDSGEKTQKLRFLGGATPGPHLAFLRAQYPDQRTAHILVAADSVDKQSFRRLRMWLRWHPLDDAPKGNEL
ncbi:MAG TPA: protein YgfX [Burkholderiales bacterium]|nr:protein YgfX [Burkholderiales bacterium]